MSRHVAWLQIACLPCTDIILKFENQSRFLHLFFPLILHGLYGCILSFDQIGVTKRDDVCILHFAVRNGFALAFLNPAIYK